MQRSHSTFLYRVKKVQYERGGKGATNVHGLHRPGHNGAPANLDPVCGPVHASDPNAMLLDPGW